VSGVTGVELGPDCCVLVRGGRLGAHRTVAAAASIPSSSWPRDRHALVERLRELRRRYDLPSRARVVAWGDDSSLAPLIDAGFEVGAVLTPAQALARVVRSRTVGAPPETAIAAVSINTHGAVIAIVSGSEVVHSRTVEWSLGTPFTGTRSELLDRYLLVSQIAPQLEHVIDLVRPVYGTTVTSTVVCGNLPNLRSLAMLLIEEMDIEVEILDAEDLLEPSVAAQTGAEDVASLQLAAAVASPGERLMSVPAEPEPIRHVAPDRDQRSPTNHTRVRLQNAMAAAAMAVCAVWSVAQVAGSSPAMRAFPNGIDTGVSVATAAETSGAGATPSAGLTPELQTAPTSGASEDVNARPVASSAPRPSSEPGVSRRRPAQQAAANGPAVGVESSEPLPSVDGIMISGDRRLAIVGGEVVAAGDLVGIRAVARIEHDGVVLKEPSGREIYVAMRPRRTPTLGS
jgi:hypothetical protein